MTIDSPFKRYSERSICVTVQLLHCIAKIVLSAQRKRLAAGKNLLHFGLQNTRLGWIEPFYRNPFDVACVCLRRLLSQSSRGCRLGVKGV